MKPTVLVTGGAGYIGSHVCRALAHAGFTPVVYDSLIYGKPERVQWGPLVQGDIRDRAALDAAFQTHKPVAVMHFAALISVGESVTQPLETYDVNFLGSFNLCQAMRASGVDTIVFSSTAAVYGTPKVVPIVEDAPKMPINPYGASKWAVEGLLDDLTSGIGWKTAALRYFNAAGALPDDGLGYIREKPLHLIPIALQAILGVRPPLDIYGSDYPTPDGTAVRDYIHVVDLAEAHVLALQALLQGTSRLRLNLGTSRGYSVREIVDACGRITGTAVPTREAPRRAGDPDSLIADATAAQRILGWSPSHSDISRIIADDWIWHQRHFQGRRA
jgi:UDP-arabinose 4-epimerase